MKVFNFKNDVDNFTVHMILKDMFDEFKEASKTFATFKITKTGVLKIYSNNPGLMIGRAGERINRYKKRLKEEANVKKVYLYECRDFVSNFGIGTF